MARILIIGGVSRDLLHVQGERIRVPGGAGLYTALAAARAGASVEMIGPRPEPMPDDLRPVAERVRWVGPRVAPERLPQFEIVQHADGGTELVSFDAGAEADLDTRDLPERLDADYAYCIPLGDPETQLRIVRALKRAGVRVAAGTYPPLAADWTATVQEIRFAADAFFCNEEEARILFGSVEAATARSGRLLFVTKGKEGVRVAQGGHVSELEGQVAAELVDSIGAGDVFCGTVLARLALGEHPILAARAGLETATRSVERSGPGALFEPALAGPAKAAPSRIRIDTQRIEAVGSCLSSNQIDTPYSFVGPQFPAIGEPGTLDFFFAATVLQFGFWNDNGRTYTEPMFATVNGREGKGSDVLWWVFRRWLTEDPHTLEPAALAEIGEQELRRRLAEDGGTDPFPQAADRLELLRAYGRDMTDQNLSPEDVLAWAADSPEPIESFLSQLDHIGGLKEDPLRKKAALLAAILRQRPERFLPLAGELPPIVDYHVQRSCLRMGLVRIEDSELSRRLRSRELLTQSEHDSVREACFRAVEDLVRASGMPMGAVDYFLFQNRTRCPEMTVPDCASCLVDSVCAHDKELFQPVRRVTYY